MSLGRTIKKLRKAAGLTQVQLAKRLGVDATYVSHLEKDRRDPSISLLRKVASTLNVPPGLLLSLALWTELPSEQKQRYAELLDSFIELAMMNQFDLPLEE